MPNYRYLIRIEASIRIDIDLYRAGNASSPRLDNVRDRDIVKFKDSESGLTKVRGMSGRISTFTVPKPEANWWCIKAGTPVPPKLVITRDTTDPKTHITHYTIRPESDMLLTEFIAQLQRFVGVEKLPIERAIALGGRWEKR